MQREGFVEISVEDLPTIEDEEQASWLPRDLGPVVRGEVAQEPPTILENHDGKRLLYEGKVNLLFAEPSSGKSWLALFACAEVLADGGSVVYVDYEDDAVGITTRLMALGVRGEAIVDRFRYVQPLTSIEDEANREDFFGLTMTCEPRLVVIDAITEAETLEGLEVNANSDWANFMQRLVHSIRRTGAGVLLLDHVAKGATALTPIGAQHKVASMTGTVLKMEAGERFAQDKDGFSTIKFIKDRTGYLPYDVGGPVARMIVTTEDDSLEIELRGPVNVRHEGSKIVFGDQGLDRTKARKICELLERESPNGLGTNAVVERITGRKATISDTLKALSAEGYLRHGEDTKFYFLRPFGGAQ